MAGYQRQSPASDNIADGQPISAQDLNQEYNAIDAAFNATTGHVHDGTAANGARITKVGDSGQLTVVGTGVTLNANVSIGDVTTGLGNVFLADNKKIAFGAGEDTTISHTAGGTTTIIAGAADIRVSNTNKKIEFNDDQASISALSSGALTITTSDVSGAGTVSITAPTSLTLSSDSIILGENGDTDVVLTFNGNDNDGSLSWMEDEDYFSFGDDILIPSTEYLFFRDTSNYIYSSAANTLDVVSNGDINITPATDGDVNIPINIGLTFATSEKIESDGTDLSIDVGALGDINLNASADVNIPANVGLTFGDDGEKIEGDGTDLSISASNNLTATVSNDFTVTATNDVNLTANNTVDIDATTVEMSNDLHLNSDESVLAFGADQDVTITHVPDSGLIFKNTSVGDNTPFVLTLQTNEDAVELDDLIGSLHFQAPNSPGAGDGDLVVAKIDAVAEATFGADTNTTGISFKTATNDEAREIVRIKGDGTTTFNDNNITNVGDIALDTISADGTTINVTMDDNVSGAFEIKEGTNSYIKVDTTDTSELITFGQNSTFAGTTISDLGTVTTADIDGGSIDGATIDNTVIGGTTAAAATFTDITADGTVDFTGATVSADTVNIDGGAIDGVTIGTNSVVTELRVDEIKIDGDTISNTSLINGDIYISPVGDGYAIIDGLKYPRADGNAGDLLSTDGSGNIGFNPLDISIDTTPQLGGDLDLLGNSIINTSSGTPEIKINADDVIITSTDATATAYPVLDLYRNSASPTQSDELGKVLFTGEDSSGAKVTYASMTSSINTGTFDSNNYQGKITVKTHGKSSGVSTEVALFEAAGTGISLGNAISLDGTTTTFNGNVDLTTGVTDVSFLKFGDVSGNITSKILTNYEEGTFTPAYTTSDPTNLDVTYTTQHGSYTRIGRLVTFQLKIVFNTVTDRGLGDIIISGLPYNKSSTDSNNPAMISNLITIGVDLGVAYQVLYAYIHGTSDSGMKLAYTQDNNSQIQATVSNFIVAAGDTIQIQGSYHV